MPQSHHTPPRGAELAPRSVFLEGRYGRMFRRLPPLVISDDDRGRLDDIANKMFEPADAGSESDGVIPAGFTYLGQFIDHDITFDPVSSLQRIQDPEGLTDFRTPRLDLDSVYGRGPDDSPFMYDPDIDDGRTTLLIGKSGTEDDLPRNTLGGKDRLRRGRALIGDPRNDENVIVSQLHLLFLKFHNKVVQFVRPRHQGLSRDELFAEAQRVTRWHYQWLVAHDFLRRVVGEKMLGEILVGDAAGGGKVGEAQIELAFYHWRREPFMPVEFSAAAYRFGHSMIRPRYKVNPQTGDIQIFTPRPLADEHQDLRGFRPLPSGWTVNWSLFFEGVPGAGPLQLSRKINTKLAEPLHDIPGVDSPSALAVRNLERGRALELPSGQSVAQAM